MKKYLLDTASRLLEKYGWIVGRHDCNTVVPLGDWKWVDYQLITQLYNPADL